MGTNVPQEWIDRVNDSGAAQLDCLLSWSTNLSSAHLQVIADRINVLRAQATPDPLIIELADKVYSMWK